MPPTPDSYACDQVDLRRERADGRNASDEAAVGNNRHIELDAVEDPRLTIDESNQTDGSRPMIVAFRILYLLVSFRSSSDLSRAFSDGEILFLL